MEYRTGEKIKYPQPYSIAVPASGNPVLDDYMREKLHHQAKQEARKRYKNKRTLSDKF